MSDAFATALFRFIGLLVIAILAAAEVLALSCNIEWLGIVASSLLGILGLGVLFLCLYAAASRES